MIFQAIHSVMQRAQGAFSVVVLIKGVGIVAFRDPHGIRFDILSFITNRPLCFGIKRDEMGNPREYAVASESIALEGIGMDRERK